MISIVDLFWSNSQHPHLLPTPISFPKIPSHQFNFLNIYIYIYKRTSSRRALVKRREIMRNSSADDVMMEIEANKPQGNSLIVGGLSPLSETLWKEKTNTEFVGDVSARLAWKDLTVMVTLGNGETQNVLEGLTGYAEPGSFTALMGPSGSGKSTLLDALSGRLAANAFLSGSILLNGRKANLSFGTAVS